jgi:hypothetical protein
MKHTPAQPEEPVLTADDHGRQNILLRIIGKLIGLKKIDPELRAAVLYSLGVIVTSSAALEAAFSAIRMAWPSFSATLGFPLVTAAAAPPFDVYTVRILLAVFLIMAVLAFWLAWNAVQKAREVFGVELLDYKEDNDIHKHAAVIVALSYVDEGQFPDHMIPTNLRRANSPEELDQRIEQFCDAEDEYWGKHPYQHILRAWHHHFVIDEDKIFIPPLFVLTSEENDRVEGSDKQLKRFKDTCEQVGDAYGKTLIEKIVVNDRFRQLNFEDFDPIREIITEAFQEIIPKELEKLTANGKLPTETKVHRPIIDITGGQRTLAIAAASVTLRKEISGFSYVSQDDHELKYYKLVPYKEESRTELV